MLKEKINESIRLLNRKYVIMYTVRWSCGTTSRILFSVYERVKGDLKNHQTIELVFHESDSIKYIKHRIEYAIIKKVDIM